MSGNETFRPVLVSERHREAVEAFAAALAEWDEHDDSLEAEQAARRRLAE